MAGQDKGLVPLAKRPLIAWVLERLAPQVGEVLISANRNLDAYAELGYPVIPDRQPDYNGPMAGICAAGRQAKGDWLLIVPCDAPFLPLDLADRLLDAAQRNGTRLARAADAEHTHYTTLLLHRGLLPDIAAHLADGRLKLRVWQARHNPATVIFTDEPDAFLNINTPDDLAQAEQRIQAAS